MHLAMGLRLSLPISQSPRGVMRRYQGYGFLAVVILFQKKKEPEEESKDILAVQLLLKTMPHSTPGNAALQGLLPKAISWSMAEREAWT